MEIVLVYAPNLNRPIENTGNRVWAYEEISMLVNHVAYQIGIYAQTNAALISKKGCQQLFLS